MLVILGFVAADVVMLVIVMALEPARYSVAVIDNKLRSDSLDVGASMHAMHAWFQFSSKVFAPTKPHQQK